MCWLNWIIPGFRMYSMDVKRRLLFNIITPFKKQMPIVSHVETQSWSKGWTDYQLDYARDCWSPPSVLSVFLSPFLLWKGNWFWESLLVWSLSKVVQPARGTTSNIPGAPQCQENSREPWSQRGHTGEKWNISCHIHKQDVTVICNFRPSKCEFRALKP